MKLVICNSLPTSKIFGNKIDAWWYARQGIDVEFWDLAPLFLAPEAIEAYYSGAPDYRYIGPRHRIFENFIDLELALQLNNDKLFWHLSRFERMHNDDHLIYLFNKYNLRYMFQHIDPPTTTPASQFRRTLRELKSKWHRRYCNPTAVVTSGRVGRSQVLNYFPDTQVISIPSAKVLWNQVDVSDNQSYVLFVDESLAYDPDSKMNNSSLCSDLTGYYRRMRNLFDRVENILGMEVYIGCSGKYLYPDPQLFFGERKIIYGQTLQLLQRCSLAVGHLSLALDQAFASVKPVLILDDPAFTKYRRQGFRDVIARFRLQPIQNTDVDKDILNQVLTRDLSFYSEVEHDWLREPGVSGDFRTLCLEAFEQLH